MADIVVVDTNVFVAALKSADGAARQVLRLCLQGDLSPIMGHKLFLEYSDVLERPGLWESSPATPADRKTLFHGFLSVCRWVNIFFLWRPNLPDEGDNHVLELAVAGGASMVITHNVSDLAGELKFPGIQVLTPGQYLRLKRWTMATMTIRLPDDKHERLKHLAEQRGLSLNKLIEEWSTVALTEFDAETRFRLLAAKGDPKKALRVLDKLDSAFAKRRP
jgi:putative PIN family toxin of toxin-antitoxin system